MQETSIIHVYNNFSLVEPGVNTFVPEARPSGLLVKIAKILAITGVLFLGFAYGPSVWYSAMGSTEKVSKILARPAGSDFGDLVNSAYLPRFDASLPLENTLTISSIGVETGLQEATPEVFEDALRKGVWRVPDFGTPAGRNKPVILTAHRYGYLAWSHSFRRSNSFYNLPKLEVGDTVEIVWKQRKYLYSVYAENEGEHITDYTADLILYTCKTLNSDVRVFKYARLLEI